MRKSDAWWIALLAIAWFFWPQPGVEVLATVDGQPVRDVSAEIAAVAARQGIDVPTFLANIDAEARVTGSSREAILASWGIHL